MKKLLCWLLLVPCYASAQFLAGIAPITGTITSAGSSCASLEMDSTSSGPSNCVSRVVPSTAATASIVLTGTFTATVQFELTADNGRTWVAAPVASSTTAGTSNFGIAGYNGVRARASAFSSGTIAVTISAGSSSRSGVTSLQNNGALNFQQTLNFLSPNTLCLDNPANNSTDCALYPDFLVDGTNNTSLGTVINAAIAASKLGGIVKDNKVGEIWATNPMPDNAYFKVQLPSGNATNPAVQTSAPVVMRGGNWLTGNGRKGSNTSSEWIGTRIIPSNTFPDAITPPSSAVTNFTCVGSAGSFSAGNYLVSAVYLTNLQTYTGTSTIVPGLTNAGTEAIVTCPGTGTISFPAFNTNSATTFGTISALQGFWAPVTTATTSYAGTVGSTCVAAPASCNVPIVVAALTNASWARGFTIAREGADCTNGGAGCAVIDVGASQEYQKIIAIDPINNKLVLAGPMLHTHTNPYPIAPSYSETLQNTTSGGAIGTNVGCAGTNVGNNAFGQMFACSPSSGSAVATTLTLTSGVGNGNMPMPRINFTAPLIVGGSTGNLGTPEFDSRLTNLQISCRRPNGTIVNGGLALVNLTIQEHGFTNSTFDRDCPNGMFIYGNQAQNSSYVMTEVNDGCASAQAANGCSGGASAITNNNYRILVQNVQPGPLGFDRISSSAANCLSTGCNYTQFSGTVLTIDRAETYVNGVHGEGNINVASVENLGSLTAFNASGGSSTTATVLSAFHVGFDARTSSSFNQMASGAISTITDDVFPGKSITTATTLTGGAGGTTSLVASDVSGLHCNQVLLIDSVASGVQEYVRIADFTASGTTPPAKSQCISGTTVTLASPPANSHSGTITMVPQDTAFNEGTFIPTGEYLVSNPCSGCVNTNRDRYTTYNGVPTIQNGAALFSSDVAATVPVVIQPGPNVTQTGDLLDIYSDNLGTVLALKVAANGTLAADNSSSWYAAGGGSAQAQTVTLAPAVAALANGLVVAWTPTAANTATAPTLAVSGLTAKPITKCGTTALIAGDLTTSAIAVAWYDGTEFQLFNPQRGICLTGSTSGIWQIQAAATAGTGTFIMPGVPASGMLTGSNSSGTISSSFTGDSNHSATVTIGSGTSIGLTSLCTTTFCGAGSYEVFAYLDITTACGTSGTYTVLLTWTDDQGSKSAFTIPLAGTGTASGVVTTTTTANWGQASFFLRSTGAAAIQYSTTAVACGSAGPMIGKLYLAVAQVQ